MTAPTLGNDGNFYGTTYQGGDLSLNSKRGFGTIFKFTTNGDLTTLVIFNGTNGASGIDAPLLGRDGNFYGTTYQGGDTNLNYGYGYGTVFRLTPNGQLTTLVYFNSTNGAGPTGLVLGTDGNFYGTTGAGGSGNLGTAFRLLIPPIPPLGPTLTLQFLADYPLLSINGILGKSYTVEYSEGLGDTNWTPLLVVPNLLHNPFQVIDPTGVGESARFYRVVTN